MASVWGHFRTRKGSNLLESHHILERTFIDLLSSTIFSGGSPEVLAIFLASKLKGVENTGQKAEFREVECIKIVPHNMLPRDNPVSILPACKTAMP